MKKLLVGDTGEYLSFEANKISSTATLLDKKNYKLIETRNGCYYTSLGDIHQVKNFCKVLMWADEIIFCPPPEENWSDKNTVANLKEKRFTIETETKEHLYQWMWLKQKPIKNLSLPNFDKENWKIRSRASSSPQIWNIGCSITAGYHIKPEQRYGELIANMLNKPLTILAHEGASTIWAANEILLADVCPGDLVIWGLTGITRYGYALHGNRHYHIQASFYNNYPLSEQLVPLEWLTSPNNLYHTLNAIMAVQNFCKKINVDLVLLGFIDTPIYNHHIKSLDLSRAKWIDYADDKKHPGPKTNQLFAERTTSYINSLKNKI